jgi:cob(I)alamin adenosyltransferase
MSIYTRTGDSGETSLGGGRRVSKADPWIEAIGTVDELNAALGLVRTYLSDPDLQALLQSIQNDLFNLGAELAAPAGQGPPEGAASHLRPDHVAALEHSIDRLSAALPPWRQFLLPGGAPGAAALHLARTIARRAERRVVAIQPPEAVNPEVRRYLNRLSDLLFVLARTVNHRSGTPELPWQP